jgi:zinc protease
VPPPDVSVPDLPDPATRRLPNGLTATALQLPGQVVHVRMRIGAGAAQDPPGREGLAIVLARTLRAGAKTRAGDGLAGILDSHHVRLRESARDLSDPAGNRSYVEISATVLPGSLQPVIDALAAMVREPALAEAAVRTTIRGLEAEVEAQAADSDWRAGRAMWERLYADGHPMGRQVEGTSASRARITQADVRAFHARHVRPEAITVAVAGSLPPDRALAAIASAFDGWKPGAAPEPSDRSRADTGPGPRAGRVHVPLDKAQASLAVGLRGVARDAPEYPALAALNYLLGETGYAGRLGEVLVDTGLAYAVYATVHADRSAGPIIVTTHAEASGETARRILATLDSFAKRGVTEAELREAKGFLLGRLPFGFESAEAASATLADLAWLGQAGDLRRFAERVRALTVDDLNRAAAKFYDPAKAVIAIAGR